MDNKLTKRRLSDLLTYDWIKILCVLLAIISVWELVFSVFSVKLTVGQHFKYYFDQDITTYGEVAFYEMLDDTFSYDVLKTNYEVIDAQYNTLNARLSIQEGDAVFANDFDKKDGKGTRARIIVDSENVITYNALLENAKTYLTGFLKDEFSVLNKEEKVQKALDFANFDDNFDFVKIENTFIKRNGKDNRFRKEKDKKDGILSEIERIRNLCKQTKDFDYLMSLDIEGLFFKYTKFEQSVLLSDDKYKATFEGYMQDEIKNGKGNAVYGINVGALKNAEKNISDYFKRKDESNADNIVLLVFDFTQYQPDLQYESISFINTVIRNFSNLYDGR